MKKHFVNKALSVALLGCGLWTAGSAVAAVRDSVYLMAYDVRVSYTHQQLPTIRLV